MWRLHAYFKFILRFTTGIYINWEISEFHPSMSSVLTLSSSIPSCPITRNAGRHRLCLTSSTHATTIVPSLSPSCQLPPPLDLAAATHSSSLPQTLCHQFSLTLINIPARSNPAEGRSCLLDPAAMAFLQVDLVTRTWRTATAKRPLAMAAVRRGGGWCRWQRRQRPTCSGCDRGGAGDVGGCRSLVAATRGAR